MKTDPLKDIASKVIHSLNLANVFVALVDNRGNIIWVNEKLAIRLGKPSHELCEQPFAALLDRNLQDLAVDILITSINEGFFQGELLMAGQDKTFPAYVTASYVPSEIETEFFILVVAIDKTSQKQIEDEARKRREFLNTIIRRVPVGIFCLDLEGRFTIVNESMNDLMERTNLDIKVNQHIDTLRDRLNPVIIDLVQSGLNGECIEFNDIPLLSEKQSKPVVSVMCSPIRYPAGKIEGLAVLMEDRTEKLRLLEQMQEADRLSSVGILAAGVAHEVNNPLTGIMGILGTLKGDAVAKGIDEEYFIRIQHNLERIRDIVQNLNTLSRKRIVEIIEMDTNELIKRTADFFRIQPGFKSQEIHVTLSEEVPKISGDIGYLEQVLHNLIINAAHANGDEGEIKITSEYNKIADEVIIRVIDTGCGIKSADLDKVFEPFFTTKEPGRGTGLGLAVSRSLIRQHGGTINIEQSGKNGTIFAIHLPVNIG